MKRRTKPEPKLSDFKEPPTYAEPFNWIARDGLVIAQRPNGQAFRTREAVLPGVDGLRDGGLITHNEVTRLALVARNAIDFIYRLNTHFVDKS